MPRKYEDEIQAINKKVRLGQIKRNTVTAEDWEILNSMNINEMKDLVSRLSVVANRYIDRAKDNGYTSPGLEPAFEREERLGRRFSENVGYDKYPNIKIGKLRSELKDILRFLDNKTITKSEANKFQKSLLKRVQSTTKKDKEDIERMKEVRNKFGLKGIKSMSEDDLKNYFRIYNQFRELDNIKSIWGTLKSEEVMTAVFSIAYKNSYDVESTMNDLMTDTQFKNDFEFLKIGNTPIQSPFDIV